MDIIMPKLRYWCRRRTWLAFLACATICHFVWFISNKFRTNISNAEISYKNRTSSKAGYRSSPVNDSEIPTLLWWDSVYTNVDDIRQCGELKCRVTNNRQLKDKKSTIMILFYASHFKPFDLPLPRDASHIWAMIHEESPRNAYIFSHPPSLSVFNFTSSYSRRADYPVTTQWLQCADWIQDETYVLPLVDKNRLRHLGLAPVLYLQSDCDVPSDRDSFVKVLQKYIPVDSYGTCLRNKKMTSGLKFNGNMAPMEDHHFFQFAARYKFTLAMENYVCDDYITEKLWRPLRLGSVPVIFGAPNIRDYLPSNKSAIIVEDFRDAEDLADYLRLLDSRDSLYQQYLEYKKEPIRNENLKHILSSRTWMSKNCLNDNGVTGDTHKLHGVPESIFSGYECYLCEKAYSYLKSNRKLKFYVTDEAYTCPSPRRFDGNGRYSVHSDVWSAEWRYGKFEAEAMLRLYRSNRVINKKDFYKLVKTIIKEHQSL